jgi:hypothetical protein|tara:strand:- start:219 stop:638 length:420 start_codon:yes stop_codon:yes gene_type:complete
MNKKSKVVSAQANGTWEGKYGVMYKHEIAFENGDAGEYSSKSAEQNKFVEGQETEYEFIDGKFPKVKPVSNFQQGGYATVKKGDNREKSIVKQSSLKCATDFVIANGGDEARVIELADMFTTWVLEDVKPTPAPQEMPF